MQIHRWAPVALALLAVALMGPGEAQPTGSLWHNDGASLGVRPSKVNCIPAGVCSYDTPNTWIEVDFDAAVAGGIPAHTKAEFLPAYSLIAGGGACEDPEDVEINGGSWVGAIVCPDDASSRLDGNLPLTENFTGTTVYFELRGHQTGADGTLDFDFYAACRDDDETMDDNWSSPANVQLVWSSDANAFKRATAGPITPNGSCAPGAHLLFKAVMDEPNTDTATVNIIGVGPQFEVADLDEVD